MQLLVAICYLATGNFQLTVANNADMSQASTGRCIRRVVYAITEVSARNIRFPTPEEVPSSKLLYHSRYAWMHAYVGLTTFIPSENVVMVLSFIVDTRVTLLTT